MPSPGEGGRLSFERDIKPLFRSKDRDSMSRVTDYTAGHDAALGLISPIFAGLSGLPPLIIQAGTHEVLLDDAILPPAKPPPPTSRSPSTSPPGCPTSSKPSTRSSTKRPLHWTEPDSSCRRISPAQNASPHSERQNARDAGLTNESRPAPRIRRSRPSNKPVAPDPLSRPLARP